MVQPTVIFALCAVVLTTAEATLRSQPRLLRPRKPLLGATASQEQDCQNALTSCADCQNVLTCTKLNDVYMPLTTTACPTSTPYCSNGQCVATLPSDDSCNKPPPTTSDFTCTGNGYFPSPSNCKKYYFCSDNLAYEYDCTNLGTTIYGHERAMCVPTTEATCTTVSCTTANIGQYQLWKQNNSIYFVCADTTAANAYVADCGKDREIDSTTGDCVLACLREGRLANDADPQKYYECVQTATNTFKGPTPGTCPGSSTFDKATERCVSGGGQSDVVNEREDIFAPRDDVSEDLYKVPDGFLIGSASAAYQIEGAWNASKKSPSVQDVYFHSRPSMANGDVACDSYNKWRDDIKMLKTLGMQTYRFSIAWTRVLPGGSQAAGADDVGVQYYNDLIDELIAENIQPIITLHHWDIPQIYQDDGGWVTNLIVSRFVDYADFVFKTYGDRVKLWVLMNEPHIFCTGAYENGWIGPGVSMPGEGGYLCVHNMILAHAKAYRLYDQTYRPTQQGTVGSSLDLTWYEANSTSQADIDAAERARIFEFAWFADPVMTGDYPKLMRDIVDANSKAEGRTTSRLPTFTDEEKTLIKGTMDFFGLNHYSSAMTAENPTKPTSASYYNDINVLTSSKDTWVKTARSGVAPWGLRYVLNWIKDRYNNFPVLISENGYAGKSDEGVNDPGRVGYYSTYMRGVMRAVNEDKCNVIGYTAWSLEDNLEWAQGYTMRFGLVYVDFDDDNRPRTPKNSASFFQEVASTRRIPFHQPVAE